MDGKLVEKRKLFRNHQNLCFGGPGLCGMYKRHNYFFYSPKGRRVSSVLWKLYKSSRCA